MLGICGQSDLRGIIEMSQRGGVREALALDMFVYRIKKYVGAYLAVLGAEVDGIVFSAGVGENSALIRGMVCQGLEVSLGYDCLDCPVYLMPASLLAP